ncbi:unnamed protein product [Brachionus calyciflorus]|uniref:Uncharacterized protein n=1 Tax=Brachionus calyciflorus TaxID=104777 RepID=A0A814EZM6_9BILA|nr:unnamed protein product [Brachionus calyciflorus]
MVQNTSSTLPLRKLNKYLDNGGDCKYYKEENLIVILNVEYGGLNSGFSSMSSSFNSSTLTNYTRLGSNSANQFSSDSNNSLVK